MGHNFIDESKTTVHKFHLIPRHGRKEINEKKAPDIAQRYFGQVRFVATLN
jgi:hypothetical protein